MPTYIEPGLIIFNATAKAAEGRVVESDTLVNGIVAIAPNNSRTTLDNLSLLPPRDANEITGEWVFEITDSTIDGEYRVIELPSLADTSGTNVGSDREIGRFTVDLAEGRKPRVRGRNFDPIIADTPNYEFEFEITDERAVDIASIAAIDVRITGPRDFNKTASQLISITPNTNTQSAIARFRVDGPFASVDDGTYRIEVPAGGISDIDGNLNTQATVGTFACSISPNPGTQGVLTDFRGRTAVPDGWTFTSTPEFLSTGMKITAGSDWFASTILGPEFPMEEGADLQIDFIPSAKTQADEVESGVGLSQQYDLFNPNSCMIWFDTGGVWSGQSGVFQAPSFIPDVAHRIRFQAFQGNLIITFSRLFQSTYVQVAQTSVPTPPKLLTAGGAYLEAKGSDITIIQVRSDNTAA